MNLPLEQELEAIATHGACEHCGCKLVILPWAAAPHLCEECCRPAQSSKSRRAEMLAVGVPEMFAQDWTRERWSQEWGIARWSKIDQIPASVQLLIFQGGTGTGKTGAAAILVDEALAAGKTAAWATCHEFVDSTRRAMEGDAATRMAMWKLLDALRSAELLVLDDFDREARYTPWELSKLVDLISTRWNRFRRTIITTNRSIAELGAGSQALASRLCMATMTAFGNDDARARL